MVQEQVAFVLDGFQGTSHLPDERDLYGEQDRQQGDGEGSDLAVGADAARVMMASTADDATVKRMAMDRTDAAWSVSTGPRRRGGSRRAGLAVVVATDTCSVCTSGRSSEIRRWS